MTDLSEPADAAWRRIRRNFRWRLPSRFNIAAAVCDVWARRQPDRLAILERRADGRLERTSYGALHDASCRFANVLARNGVRPGDRVAILLPQSPAVVVAHLAIARLGAMALPLAVLFGPDALSFRLAHSGAAAIILDAGGLAKIRAIKPGLPELRTIVSVDGADGEAIGYEAALAGASADFVTIDSSPDDPAMMIYTSGTTGQPKGAVHGHRVVPAHVPGLRFAHAGLGRDGDLMWTPADWAWAGGLLNVLLPSLMLGVPVLAWAQRFQPEEAIAGIAALGVRNAFLPPTALRMFQAAHRPGQRYATKLRSIMSAGETLGPETFAWARQAFGLTVNELYGQTECNLVLGSCEALGVSKAGAIGKAVPGHNVAVLAPDGRPCAPGEMGEIAVKAPDPVMFLHYWRDEAATASKFRGSYLLTGDQAMRDDEGYVHFVGRSDDIITSAGYRIGPGEIEDCLMRHPAVAYAAVIGKKDALRTEIVKAFVVVKPGVAAEAALTKDLQDFVRARLSAHEYPREIAYVASLPLTSSGKIIRRDLRALG